MTDPSHQSEIQIGPRIRELRHERGLTLTELASEAGISASHLSRLERNQAVPSFTVAASIASVVGVLPSDLIPQESAGIGSASVSS